MHSNYCKKVSGIEPTAKNNNPLNHDLVAMAYLLKLKLPSLKVTQTGSRGGIAQHRTIPRGSHASAVNDNRGCGDCNDEILGTVTTDSTVIDALNATMSTGFDTEEHQTENQTLPSLHEVREKAAAAVESNSMPAGQKCIMCDLEATHRCVQ